jgi:hypothetical protein
MEPATTAPSRRVPRRRMSMPSAFCYRIRFIYSVGFIQSAAGRGVKARSTPLQTALRRRAATQEGGSPRAAS